MTAIEKLIEKINGVVSTESALDLANKVKRELEAAKDEVARLNKELATSCAAELDTNNKRHALEQQVKELEARTFDLAKDLAAKSAKSAEGAKDMMGTSRWEEVHAEAQRHYEYARNWMSKLNASNQPQAFEALEKLIAIVHKTYGDFCTLDTAAQAFKDKATQLANQRDQVLGATKRCQNLHSFVEQRERQLSRTAEALTAAEKDLADLRWLVRLAREGATRQAAPLLVLSTTGPARVPPPPPVCGANAAAQAEGGVK